MRMGVLLTPSGMGCKGDGTFRSRKRPMAEVMLASGRVEASVCRVGVEC